MEGYSIIPCSPQSNLHISTLILVCCGVLDDVVDDRDPLLRDDCDVGLTNTSEIDGKAKR